MRQNAFAAGHAGELTAFLRPPGWIWGRSGEGRGTEGEGKEGEGGREREEEPDCYNISSALNVRCFCFIAFDYY